MFLVNQNGSCIRLDAVRCMYRSDAPLTDIILHSKTAQVRFHYKSVEEREKAWCDIHQRLLQAHNGYVADLGPHAIVLEAIEAIDCGLSLVVIYTDAGKFSYKIKEWENRSEIKENINENLGLYIKS